MTTKPTILIVDDEPATLKALSFILEKKGYHVDLVADGETALEQAVKSPPDLILLDIYLPGMNGYELCQALKVDDQTRDIPVIFISGHRDSEENIKAFTVGGVDYVPKPIQYKEVLARVKTHLSVRSLQKQLEEKNIRLEQDMAKQSQTEKELRASKEKLQALFDNMLDGFAYHQIITNESGEPVDYVFLEVNKAFEQFTGLKQRDIIGKRVTEVHTNIKDLPFDWIETYGRVALSGEPVRFEQYFEPQDHWYKVVAFSPQKNYFAITFENITRRKQAEQKIREYSEQLETRVKERTQKLKDAQTQLVRKGKLAVLGQLAGSVAHELRNPLGTLSNAIYFLNTTLTDVNETTREYLDLMADEIRKSEKIVSDLLDFSRTRLDERAEKEMVALSALIEPVLAEQPPPETVTVETHLEADLPPVWVDAQQMKQVLSNLVVNAYQAMPDGGALTVTARRKDNEIKLSLEDTGCGMSREHKEKLFEPLFTTKKKGIGLGLAVSKNLLETNGGMIAVASEEGEGTVFTLTLPVKDT